MQVVPPGVQNWNQYRYQVIKRKWRHLLKKAKACDVVYLAIGHGDLKETFPDAQISRLVTKTNSWVYMGNFEVAPNTRHEHHLSDRTFLTRQIYYIFLFTFFFLVVEV